ncbi:ABC transporter ATP-binding protein [Kribbella koreensis]|uniref:ABC transporter ATP-binding protein n=1 Tax=Kribbella koreensis TaxID=57909 RepID=A0ABN1QTI2_9ACTN
MSTADALQCTDLYRFFRAGDEETLALRGVSLRVGRGETVAVAGPSGSGKSTLLNCLAGLDEPAGGAVVVGGEQISHRPESRRARIRSQRLGILLQSGNLVAHLSVRDNIRLAQAAARRRSANTQDQSHPAGCRSRTPEELLDQVGLTSRATAIPTELSGGELARAGLAVAVSNNPDALLADEPTGELDGTTERLVLELIRDRAARGTGVLIVTHSSVVMRIADRVIRLHDGRIVA